MGAIHSSETIPPLRTIPVSVVAGSHIGSWSDSVIKSVLHYTSPTIATHGLCTIRVEVYHAEVIPLFLFQQYDSIGTDASAAITESDNSLVVQLYNILPIIDDDEVIRSAMVFFKIYFHLLVCELVQIVSRTDFQLYTRYIYVCNN